MLYLHVTFRWFSLTFTEKITLSNVEYPIAVYANFPVNYLGVGSLGTLISWYTTRDQMMSCLQVKFSSGKSNKHSIILYFLWKEVNISENRYCNRYLQISIAFEGAPYPHLKTQSSTEKTDPAKNSGNNSYCSEKVEISIRLSDIPIKMFIYKWIG